MRDCDIDYFDIVAKEMVEVNEKRLFEDYKATEQISEAVLMMNPKHKGQMGEFLYVSGLKIPIIWHRYVEEDKAYMINDKDMAKNVREMYDVRL